MCYVRNNDNKQSGIRTYDNTWYSLSRNKEGAKQWGKYNIPIYTDSRIYAHGRISKKDINMTEGVHLLEYILRKWQ